MTDIMTEKTRIEFEILALEEYDKSLKSSIQKCAKNQNDEFYTSVADTLRRKRAQVQEWRNNLKEQSETVKQLMEWEKRASILDKLADSSMPSLDGREMAEEQLRSLKEKAYTAQALVDLRM